MAGSVGGVAGAPFFRAAKIARGDQAVCFGGFGDGDPLGIDHGLALTLSNPVPGHAPAGQFAHGLRSGVHEHPRNPLITAPVRALDSVLEVHVLVVTATHDRIGQTGLHAALGGRRMRSLGRYQTEHDDIEPATLDADRGTQPGQAAANHQNIGVDQLHRDFSTDLSICGGEYSSP